MRARDLLVSNVIVVALVAACGGGEATLAQETCERLDDCNALPAGNSVNECAESVERDLDGLSSAQRNDTEKLLGDCLEFETCTLLLSCLDFEAPSSPPADPPPGDGPPTDPPPQGTGHFALDWSIERGGAASTCAAVGAANVRVTSRGPAGTYLDNFACADLEGTTLGLPSGTYSVVISIHDTAGATLGATAPLAETLGAGQLVDLGGVTFQFN